MSKALLEGLNPQQARAVCHESGPMLILAGAGSGKTRVITHRFAYLAKKNSPSSILAVTFTNKAAQEMRERIGQITRKDLRGAWIGTFHSQCNRILRRDIARIDYRPGFSIYDETDQSNLIRHILREFKIYEALYRGILSRISHLKACCVTPDQFLADGDGFGFEERLARVYVRYQDELKRSNCLDYDDLLMLTVKLFEEHPSVLEKYQKKFRHVLVDEFQDTNPVQYRLLKLLVARHGNLCVVGDDDQSIYGFRGANVQNILTFEDDFSDAEVVKLEQNYRSTQHILDVSDGVIQGANRRRPKKLWSELAEGDKVSQCWFSSEHEEARYTAKLIKEFYLKGVHEYRDCAVLFRTNLQSKPLEDAFRREKIPYLFLGATSFYHRKEIKDMTAYLRLVINRDDNVALRRILNTPPRGIGASTSSKVEQTAKKKSLSLYGAVRSLLRTGSLTTTAKEKLEGFVDLIEELAEENYKDAADLLQTIYIKTGYSNAVDEERAENVAELITSAEGRDVDEFADMLSLSTPSDEPLRDNAVSLLTLHSAKGLEFPVVFVSGLEEGVLPYFKAETPAEVDEERRLLYVGMTRARRILCLTGTSRRRLYSKVQQQERSRFLKDIPDRCCVHIEKIADTGSAPQRGGRIKTFRQPSTSAYTIGTRVKHPKWGVGVVRDCYGEADDQKITVNFPNIGVKRLALKFANLERIR